jgi:hypothetical protein
MIAIVDKDRQRALFVSDSLGLLLASLAAFLTPPYTADLSRASAVLVLGMAMLWSMSLRYSGAYEYQGRWAELAAIFKGALLFTVLVITIGSLRGHFLPHMPFVIAASMLASLLFRKTVAPALLRLAGHGQPIRILIVGAGAAGQRLPELLGSEQLYELRCIASEPDSGSRGPDSYDPLRRVLQDYQPHEVILALNGDTGARLEGILSLCNQKKIPWKVVPSLGHLDATDLRCQIVGGLPLIGLQTSVFAGMNVRIKQALDLTLASLLMIPAAPLMAVIWVAIRLDSPGPGLIRQARIGYKGRVFHIYKFRTMFVDSDDSQHRHYVKEWYAGKSYGEGDANGTEKAP